MTLPAKELVLRQLMREKMHLEPEALRLSPLAVRQRYAHAWAPVQHLATLIRPCPLGLLSWWAECPRGHLLLTHLPSQYTEGPHRLRIETIENVAHVCLNDLGRQPRVALQPAACLLDHLMGSQGLAEGAWLSDGAGVVPELADVGGRVRECAALGYLEDYTDAPGGRGYFAVAVAWYLVESQRLNVLDPRIHRLLRNSLLSESFWSNIAPSLPRAS